jgi:hypothetical protein
MEAAAVSADAMRIVMSFFSAPPLPEPAEPEGLWEAPPLSGLLPDMQPLSKATVSKRQSKDNHFILMFNPLLFIKMK